MSSKTRNINKLIINKQMALPLTFKSIKNRENFLVSKCNKEAVSLLENIIFWKNKEKISSIPGAIIHGPKGSGKTHLCEIFKQHYDSVYLLSLNRKDLERNMEGRNFILDNFIPSKRFPSELVMHFINRVTNNNGSILFLSQQSPYEMDWKLEDLNSRIRSLMSCEIKLPDDILLYSFIVKYAQDKNLYINDKKIIYMLKRLDRNFESVINVIDKLDIYTLETKEKISYKNIKTILNSIIKH